jgi:hypothetical protein
MSLSNKNVGNYYEYHEIDNGFYYVYHRMGFIGLIIFIIVITILVKPLTLKPMLFILVFWVVSNSLSIHFFSINSSALFMSIVYFHNRKQVKSSHQRKINQ